MGLLEAIGLALPALGLLTWLVVVACAPRLMRRSPLGSPTGATSARLWLYAPIWVPAALVLCALLPGVFETIFAESSHCVSHYTAHHHHLCIAHPPIVTGHALMGIVPALVGGAALLMIGRRMLSTLREWRLSRTLVALSAPSDLGPDIRRLDDKGPLAVTVGWRRPTILLSDGFLSNVSPQTLAVVLAHERAHVDRKDVRAALFDRFAGALLPCSVANPLLARIALRREQACDAVAATKTGGPLAVAAALTEVARLRLPTLAYGQSIAASSLEARVLHLIDPALTPSLRRSRLMLVGLMAVIVASGWPLHDAIERVITFLVH